MRILFFTENGYCGGLDSFLVHLIDHWPHGDDELILACNQGHPGLAVIRSRLRRRCRIIAHRIPLQWEWMRRLAGIPMFGRAARWLSPPLRYLFFAAYLVALRRFFARHGADRLMVVNGGYPAGDTCRAATIAWGAFTDRAPAIHNFHNFAIPPRWWERWAENAIDRGVIRHSKFMVSVSAACARSMARRPAIGLSEKIGFVHNGIGPMERGARASADELKNALGIPAGGRICLMLGTYEPRKGHAFALDAFRRVLDAVPSAHLVICGYGRGDEVSAVRRLVDAAGLFDNVHLEPFRDDVGALLGAADVLWVSSQAFESFGLTVVEAWAEKVPVVATRVGGIPEVMGGGEGGFCVAPDDAAGFAECVVRLLNDPALRGTLGEGGYRRYGLNFTAERMAGEYACIVRDGAPPNPVA